MIASLKDRLPARKVSVFSRVGGLLIFSRLLCVLFVFVDQPRTDPSVEFVVAGMYLLLAVQFFLHCGALFWREIGRFGSSRVDCWWWCIRCWCLSGLGGGSLRGEANF